jgi:uncharacterized protein (TIGR03545 family)
MIRPKLPAIFRWKYVLPRVAILAAVVAAVRFGLDPALKYLIVAGGEAALGAKVDVAELSTSLADGRITIDGFAATNPQRPMHNLAAAERMQLDVDVAALLRKRLVVKNGVVSGIVLDSDRTESGALDPTTAEADAGPSMFDPVVDAASDTATDWFNGLSERAEADLEEKLATPRVLREREAAWETQYAALKTRADSLRAKAKQIETDFREAKKNPLRAAQQLQTIQQQLVETQAELKSTIGELQALPAQAKADKQAIDEARKQDQAFLKETLNIAKTDGGQLTEYLLGDLAHGYVAQSVGWVNYLRTWVPKSKMMRPARAPGTNVLFVDRRQPQCLIERVELTGSAQVDGQPLEITGLLTDASTEPELHQRPMQLRLVSGGAISGDLLVTVDRRRGASHDTLVLNCPHLKLGERTLGKADSLAVNVASGEASLAAEITLEGDALSGFIRLHQASTLAASTPALHDKRIADMLSESLQGVDQLDADIELAGTTRKPQIKIESNLGPQLAEGINGAVRKYLTESRDRLIVKVQGKVDDQLAKLDARRQAAQQQLLGKLGEDQQSFSQIAALMGGGGSLGGAVSGALGGVSIPQLGKVLPRDLIQR